MSQPRRCNYDTRGKSNAVTRATNTMAVLQVHTPPSDGNSTVVHPIQKTMVGILVARHCGEVGQGGCCDHGSRMCLHHVPNAANALSTGHRLQHHHVLREEAVLAGFTVAMGMGRFEKTIFFFTTAMISHRTCFPVSSFSSSSSSEACMPMFRTCLCSTPSGLGRLTTLPSSK